MENKKRTVELPSSPARRLKIRLERCCEVSRANFVMGPAAAREENVESRGVYGTLQGVNAADNLVE